MVYFLVLLLGQEGTDLRFGFVLLVFFTFIFRVHLICKINLSLRYFRCLDSGVVRTSVSESIGPGSIPGGRVSNFEFFFFSFSFFLEVNNFFSFFSSFQSPMIYQNKSEKL